MVGFVKCEDILVFIAEDADKRSEEVIEDDFAEEFEVGWVDILSFIEYDDVVCEVTFWFFFEFEDGEDDVIVEAGFVVVFDAE